MHKPLIVKLLVVGVCMFAFSFALVPLYNVFCELTGLNGKTENSAAVASVVIDRERQVTVEFLATVDPSIPWKFQPEIAQMVVYPGEVKRINFTAQNLTAEPMSGRAVPSVAPGLAAEQFKKMECFCFVEQPLNGGETKLMPLQFYIDPALPKDIKTVTLSYTLYKVDAH